MWSARAEQIVSDLIANLGPNQRDPRRTDAVRLNALPICGSMWASYYLRPDGKVVIVGEDYDHPDVDTIHADRLSVLKVLVGGAERYPELRELLPNREPGATDCQVCRQLSNVFGLGKVICPTCGGIGWLPPADGIA